MIKTTSGGYLNEGLFALLKFFITGNDKHLPKKLQDLKQVRDEFNDIQKDVEKKLKKKVVVGGQEMTLSDLINKMDKPNSKYHFGDDI